MNYDVTVVMYHYVRNLSLSRYPDIKGMEVRDFKKQLQYLGENHNFVTVEECIKQLESPSSDFPENAVLLTFDDGYLEHFTEVFPILVEMGIQGAFFPPVKSTVERKVLDVNKIHFVLASEPDSNHLLELLSSYIQRYKQTYDLLEPEDYFRRIDKTEHPYDPMEVIIFKRVLQRELPKKVRTGIIDDLFQEIVGIPEENFAEELYMKKKHLKCMLRNGMFVGGHGYSHDWLNSIDEKQLEAEAKKTRSFLADLGVNRNAWVMSYPYGGYNQSVQDVLKQNDYSMAFTTQDAKAVLQEENRFAITRIDTNEIGQG